MSLQRSGCTIVLFSFFLSLILMILSVLTETATNVVDAAVVKVLFRTNLPPLGDCSAKNG